LTVTCSRPRQLREQELKRRGTNLLADVDHLAPRQLLVELGVERLVAFLVVLDPLPEVPFRLLGWHPVVVGVSGRDFDCDVGGNDGGVGTNRLDEKEFEARFALDALKECLATCTSRVGGVCENTRQHEKGSGTRTRLTVDANVPSRLEPSNQVLQAFCRHHLALL
jgi:hypothetical protein